MDARRPARPYVRACIVAAILSVTVSVSVASPGLADGTSQTPPQATVTGSTTPLTGTTSSAVSPSGLSKPGKATREQLLAVLTHLDRVGFPVGDPNAALSGEQRRGLCIAREFVGLRSHRGNLTSQEVDVLLRISVPLTSPRRAVDGLNVSLTCQSAWYASQGFVSRVMRATTGLKPGWTPTGTFKVSSRTTGWTYSTIYEDARLYKIHRFRGAVGFHGVASPSWIKTVPASHGCVRLPNRDMDWLSKRMQVGSTVRVYGAW